MSVSAILSPIAHAQGVGSVCLLRMLLYVFFAPAHAHAHKIVSICACYACSGTEPSKS